MRLRKSQTLFATLALFAVAAAGCSQAPPQPAVTKDSFSANNKAQALKDAQSWMASHPANQANTVKPQPQPAGMPQ